MDLLCCRTPYLHELQCLHRNMLLLHKRRKVSGCCVTGIALAGIDFYGGAAVKMWCVFFVVFFRVVRVYAVRIVS